ncbi:hypothetical protein MML48_3g00004895 [Holotrichia oblita]|uniref:Uncharacterized protein n=1 Tax=Holotrichia oblita TaxID=644536 RepID=A0ACB9TFB7_HOLOL|nr:hypothetical protein MML48_3g00004895 [Holotrichia oblita]
MLVTMPLERSTSTNTPLPAPRHNKVARVASMNRLNQEHSLKESFKRELSEKMQFISSEETRKPPEIIPREPTSKEEEINNEVDKMPTTTILFDDIQTYSPKKDVLITNESSKTDVYEKIDSAVTPTDDLSLIEASLIYQNDINPYLENVTILSTYNESQRSSDPKSPTSIKDEEYLSDSYFRRKSGGSISSFVSDFSVTSTNSKGSKPEIVGVIPKKRKQSNFDTLSRKRGFQIGSSLINMEAEDESSSMTSLTSDDKLSFDHMSLSSKTSDYSTQANDIEMSDINEEIFTKSVSRKTGKQFKEKHMNELLGMHDLDVEYKKNTIEKNQSASSLKSMDSIPGFMGGSNMRKWKNTQDLDDISVVSTSSLHGRNKWVVESISTVPTNQTPPESISSSVVPPSTTTSTTSSTRTSVTKASTSIAETNQVPNIVLESQTAPPPPQRRERIDSEDHTKQTETDISISLSESKNESDSGICEKEDLELETVWQYQLPSPPKAFRDASPAVPTISQYDTETLPDSVVTNPELFEKLQFVKDIQDAEVESDIPSVVSEEEKEICNKLTLEHLEKRKSLVYNRELATSLKFAQDNERNEDKSVKILKSDQLEDVSTGTNSDTYSNKINTSITNTAKLQENFKSITADRNLPNFQISSYDAKKEKINIFEDDTIRSNSNQIATIAKLDSPPAPILDKPRNMSNDDKVDSSETISSRKNSSSDAGEKHDQEVFKKPQEVSAYRLKNSFYDKNKNVNATSNKSVARSGSFSMNTEIWTPTIPVKRSKSQVALNKYREDGNTKSENLSRSNSLLDVSSSLQSLEVMKKIQNKLSSSKEELDIKPPQEVNSEPPVSAEPKPIPPPKTAPPPAQVTTAWTPPSINLGTWSQRPKTQVMVKEDTDYKFSTKVITSTTQENDLQKASTLKPTSSLNNYKSSTININNNNTHQVSNGVSIKVNGVEPISSQKSGNVVIKIAGTDSSKELDGSSSRFINHFTPEGYRKPFGNVNKIERIRPHSIAFDNQFDISRVPVVRSVELKKPFKDLQNNKSITQIYTNSIKINDNEPKSLNYSNSPNSESDLKSENKRSNVYLSNESINKPVFRNNSFTPIVKGFRTDTTAPVNRKVWSMYGTLPTKPDNNQNELNTNRNVPFSQMNLRRTESNKVLHSNAHSASNNSNTFDNVILRNSNNSNYKAVIKEFSDEAPEIPALPTPPPPPQVPKENSLKWQKSTDTADARAELLNAIRNFGGKSGLRATKG